MSVRAMCSKFRPLAPLFTLLAVFALLARIAVPTGWMPAQDDDGIVRITLCTGYGLQQAWIDSEGTLHRGDPADGDGSDSQQHCPFTASALPFALGNAPPLPIVPLALEAMPTIPSVATTPGRGLAAPPPPQTGPPLTA